MEFEDVLPVKESVFGKIGVVSSPIKIHYPCTNVRLVRMHPAIFVFIGDTKIFHEFLIRLMSQILYYLVASNFQFSLRSSMGIDI